ncbi:MAG: hypothetical protein ACJ731_03535 [Vicinamibacterales bacterium]
MIWREKRVLLILLALVLAANTVFFFTYRVQYQSRLDALDERLAQVQGEYEQIHAARIRGEQTFQSYRKVENDVLTVFNEHWATQPERFTKMFAEVTRLAMASSLVPSSYSFGRTLEKRVSSGSRRETLGATEVTITFGVQGTYEQARRLINLLELSQQFVIIESITLNAAPAEQTLSLDLKLKSIFRDEENGVASNRL